MTTIQRLEALKVDLELQGLEVMHGQIDAIKASHLAEIKALQPKPKKMIAKKAKDQPLKLQITEAGKTTEIFFDSEKEAEAFLKLKQKQRISTHRLPIGFSLPSMLAYGGTYADKLERYKKEEKEYWQAAKEQNLDFHVIISKP